MDLFFPNIREIKCPSLSAVNRVGVMESFYWFPHRVGVMESFYWFSSFVSMDILFIVSAILCSTRFVCYSFPNCNSSV